MPENRQASNDGSEILKLQILDIRGTSEHSSTTRELKQEIIRGLSSKTINFQDYRAVKENRKPPIITLRSLPTMLLYDSKGLDIFDRITYDKDYYLTNAEIEILSENSKYFVQKYLSDGDYIIELGAGSMRKTDYILRAISDLNISITYYAVDLSESSLKKSLEPYVARYPRIKFVGMWGTYHDSLKWIKDFQGNKVVKKVYLWLGSSIGNYQRDQAAKLMVQFCEQGIDTGDLFLCGIDRRNSYEAVSLAYNDRSGLTREFALNGLSNANSIFGKQVFNLENFEYVSIYNELEGRHEAYFEVNEDHTIEFDNESEIIKLQKGELIQFEYSYKYSAAEVETLVRSAGLGQLGKYTDSKNMYDLHIFFKFPFLFREEHDQIGILNMLRWDDLFQARYFVLI